MTNNYKHFRYESFTIQVSYEVLKVWSEYEQINSSDTEACGVMIGGYNKLAKTIFIEKCTRPLKNDIRKKYSFLLKDSGHQKAVNEAFNSADECLFYLGTWHTHPQPTPLASLTDKKDWQECIKRNNSLPVFVFAIIGTKNIFFFAREGSLDDK